MLLLLFFLMVIQKLVFLLNLQNIMEIMVLIIN